MEDFARALQALSMGGILPMARSAPTTPLPFVLQADAIEAALRADADGTMARNLLPHLPPGQQTEEHLRDILRSPQLHQAMQSLTAALDSEQAQAVISNLGLRSSDATTAMATGDAVAGLVAAVQADADRRRGTTTPATADAASSAPSQQNNGTNNGGAPGQPQQ
jgi:hypothetical protein